jgi:flagellin-like hook-associated protein FlgL
MSDITLSAGVRQNLLSLQNTADLMSTTQNRLATGKKVNSALDNPTNFFTSQSLSARANDLSSLLDGINNGIKTIEAADNGIKAITRLVESAQSTVKQAQQNNTSETSTQIQGGFSINTNGSTGSTTKARAENQTLDNLGLAANDTLSLTSTDSNGTTSNFTYTVSATPANESVSDIVAAINASGVASAEVTDDGRLNINSNGNASLNLTLTDAVGVHTGTTGTDTVGTAAAADLSGVAVFSNLGFTEVLDVDGVDTTNTANNDPTDPGGTDYDVDFGTTTGDVATLSVTNYAADSTTADNSNLVAQFNDIRTQIDKLADDASFNGSNLINSATSSLTIALNEKRDSTKSELTVDGADLTSSGLSIASAATLNSTESETLLDSLSAALGTLRDTATSLGSNLNTVKIREDFTKEMVNTLQTGADDLVLADGNEEAANMLALQTRQQLSSTALSLASQADQAILRLF